MIVCARLQTQQCTTAMKNEASIVAVVPLEVPIQRGFPLEPEVGNFLAYTLRFTILAPISGQGVVSTIMPPIR
jgi:hypothetical protein